MRIISGNSKGKKILLPTDKSTRPLKDLVKESIFNVLEHSNKLNLSISGSNILDLFSGSGSFGIEAISRGAKKVYFVENYQAAFDILSINISNLDFQNSSEIVNDDCFNYLDKLNFDEAHFDLIFLDPPYKENRINTLIETVLNKKILKKEGIIIIHRHKKDNIELTKKMKIIDQRNYGISKIIFGN